MDFSRVAGLALLLVVLSFVQDGTSASLDDSIQSQGIKPLSIVRKVIGGSKTQPGEYPYMVSLRAPAGTVVKGTDIGGQHYCGGALIDKNIVLTAGHCLKPYGFHNVDVHIGRYNREGDDEGRFQAFRTKDTRIHPSFDYNRGWINFDVALLVLDGESQARSVEFARNEDGLGSGSGVVLGWGNTAAGDSSSVSEVLLKAFVPLLTKDACRNLYNDGSLITEHMTCAGQKGTDACQLDSGGPLLVDGKVAGVVSWGSGCGGDKPGVYASVGALAGWIDGQIREINNLPPANNEDCSFRLGRWFPPGCRN